MKIIWQIADGILNFLFPSECVGCGAEGATVCEKCVAKIKLCPKNSITSREIAHIYPLSTWREEIIRKAVKKLKFRFSRTVADDLKPFFAKALQKVPFPKNAVFVPVPLHWLRRNLRGFNQSENIARVFSEITGLKIESNLIYRQKNTYPQSLLRGEARIVNLQNAFAPKKALLPKETPLFLVDDVTVSHATLTECAKVLKKMGYHNLSAVVIATGTA